jgi:multiple sugar transport system permease protein
MTRSPSCWFWRRQATHVVLNLLTLCVVAVVAFPLYWMLVVSLKPWDEIFSVPPTFLPLRPTLAHYASLLTRTKFLLFFKNSTLVALQTTALVVTAGVLGAYSLTRFRYPGRRLIERTIPLLYMVPSIVVAIPILLILVQLRLTNTQFGLVLAYCTFSLPFALLMLKPFFEAVPIQIEEAAMVDGAGRLRVLWSVVLPVVTPGIIAIATFTFILAWNEYLFAVILVSSDSLKMLPVGVAEFRDAMSVEWGLMMAASVALTLPVLVLFMIAQRHLIRGLSAGSVVG